MGLFGVDVFLQLQWIWTCTYLTGKWSASEDALCQKLSQVKLFANLDCIFLSNHPLSSCNGLIEMNEDTEFVFFNAALLLVWTLSMRACVCVCVFEYVKAQGNVGWLAGSMMAICAAVCFECNLRPGSAGTQCMLGQLLIVWRSTRSPKFTTHRGSDPTWPNPT